MTTLGLTAHRAGRQPSSGSVYDLAIMHQLKLVAEFSHRRRILAVDCVRLLEISAGEGRDTHEAEGVGTDVVSGNVLGHIASSDGEIPGAVGEECVLHYRGLTNALPLASGEAEPAVGAIRVEEAHMDHSIGIGVGVRIDHNGVD